MKDVHLHLGGRVICRTGRLFQLRIGCLWNLYNQCFRKLCRNSCASRRLEPKFEGLLNGPTGMRSGEASARRQYASGEDVRKQARASLSRPSRPHTPRESTLSSSSRNTHTQQRGTSASLSVHTQRSNKDGISDGSGQSAPPQANVNTLEQLTCNLRASTPGSDGALEAEKALSAFCAQPSNDASFAASPGTLAALLRTCSARAATAVRNATCGAASVHAVASDSDCLAALQISLDALLQQAPKQFKGLAELVTVVRNLAAAGFQPACLSKRLHVPIVAALALSLEAPRSNVETISQQNADYLVSCCCRALSKLSVHISGAQALATHEHAIATLLQAAQRLHANMLVSSRALHALCNTLEASASARSSVSLDALGAFHSVSTLVHVHLGEVNKAGSTCISDGAVDSSMRIARLVSAVTSTSEGARMLLEVDPGVPLQLQGALETANEEKDNELELMLNAQCALANCALFMDTTKAEESDAAAVSNGTLCRCVDACMRLLLGENKEGTEEASRTLANLVYISRSAAHHAVFNSKAAEAAILWLDSSVSTIVTNCCGFVINATSAESSTDVSAKLVELGLLQRLARILHSHAINVSHTAAKAAVNVLRQLPLGGATASNEVVELQTASTFAANIAAAVARDTSQVAQCRADAAEMHDTTLRSLNAYLAQVP